MVLVGCSSESSVPETNSEKFQKAVSDFYVSLAAIQSDHALFAIEKMQEVATQYPKEPSVWANLSVYSMRQGNFELATERMQKALARAADNADILFLAGILESRKGNISKAISYLQSAAEQNPKDPMILYSLADELERQGLQKNASEINTLLQSILTQDPNNLAVLLETVRTAAKWDNPEAMKQALADLEKLSKNWPSQIRSQFKNQRASILEKGGGNITFELAFLRNNLNQIPQFQADLRKVQFPPNQVGFLLSKFLWLPNIKHRAAAPDSSLSFSVNSSAKESAQLFKPIDLANDQRGSVITISKGVAEINSKQNLKFPATSGDQYLSPYSVTTLDYNYDFLNDLVFVTANGFTLYEQQADSTFKDVTNRLELPEEIINGNYTGSWSYDFDLDGDLDILLSAQNDESWILRNNGDGTFDLNETFKESENIADFLWADFDSDGDSDAAVLTGDGDTDFYRNERSGTFRLDSSFAIPGKTKAFDVGDIDSDGVFEIVSWNKNSVSSTTFVDSTNSWKSESLVRVTDSKSIEKYPQLFLADLDNNASLDILISSKDESRYWLSDENAELTSESRTLPYFIYGLSDINGDNRLDLVGLNDKQTPVTLSSNGSKNYNARIISPRASGPLGDKRINSFGIGGEIESRSGLQYVKQPIDKSWVHVGLGTYEEAEMLRIIWPNGSVQAEFAELGYGNKIMNEQILKGSCPWIMTYNGKEMEFVTDFLWRTALGLRINAQGKANVIHSIDWVKIDGEQLKPRNGFYDVRITADLWETHFFDHVSLMAVDYPEDTEIFVDERFTLPAPEQKLYAFEQTYPVEKATDQDGRDVTGVLKERDKNYLNSFELTPYQGLAKEHYVEVEIGERVPLNKKLKLIASGWVYPTDTSINIAISQGDHPPPHGIRVEIPDGRGGWKVLHENIGFPAGKNKTVLVDLKNAFDSKVNRRARLYTNMEIYWDQIRAGIQNGDINLETQKLQASESKLRYRGFSKLVQKDRFLPTEPDYQQISGTTPKWRDLVGFYTRFGDVGELTKEIDDRYVIMNAGDELVFKFPSLDAPKEGWKRDFVLIGDGWVKDGDYNTGHSKTVLPLPYHGMENYSAEPGLLQDDPVYQKHKKDWAIYHTRYISPKNFNTALQFED